MRKNLNNLMLVLLLVTLALSLSAFRQADLSLQAPGDRLVLGDNYTLKQGETLDGNLIVLGGNATLETESRVEQDVVILGGNLMVQGSIGGDINVVGGLVTLGESAVIEGDVNSFSGQLIQDEGATVEGDVNNNLTLPFIFSAPARLTIPNFEGGLSLPKLPYSAPNALDMGLGLAGGVLWWLGRSFIWAILALLVGLFIPRNAERAAAAASGKPAVAGGLGCLTLLVVPVMLVLLFISICGIPFGLLGLFLLIAAWAFGIIALGLETGKRLGLLLKQDWALPVSAMVGTFLLTLLVNGVGALVPCIGWLVPALVGMVGLGAALVTRYGARALPDTEGVSSSAYSTQVVETIPLPSSPPENLSSDLPAVDTQPPGEEK